MKRAIKMYLYQNLTTDFPPKVRFYLIHCRENVSKIYYTPEDDKIDLNMSEYQDNSIQSLTVESTYCQSFS